MWTYVQVHVLTCLSTFTEHYLDEAVTIISNFSCCPLHELVWSCIVYMLQATLPLSPKAQTGCFATVPCTDFFPVTARLSRRQNSCGGVAKNDSSLALLGLVPLFWIVFEGRDLRWISWDPKRHLKKGSQRDWNEFVLGGASIYKITGKGKLEKWSNVAQAFAN